MVMSEYTTRSLSPSVCTHSNSNNISRSIPSGLGIEDRQHHTAPDSNMECFQTQYYHCPTRHHYQDMHSHAVSTDDLSSPTDHTMMTEDDSSLVTTSGQQYWLDDRSREASPHYGSQGYGGAGHHHGFGSYGYDDCQQLGDHHYYQYGTLSSSAPNLSMDTMDVTLTSLHSQQQVHQQTASSQILQSQHHHNHHLGMVTNGDVLKMSNAPVVRVVKRRNTANRKERRRTQSINTAFADLRDCIPNVPADTKLSKTIGRKLKCRTQNINSAYTVLRQRIPNVPEDTKLSKIKTLRLATSYISYLMGVLESDLNEPVSGFRAELPGGSTGRGGRGSRGGGRGSGTAGQQNQYCNNNNNNNNTSLESKEGLNEVVSSDDLSNDCRRSKGRTGWPQHVWALELKQEQHNI